mmetsp:Transcript_49080/g.138617  ORF Transcript_49080/g.138617 Transcript_49080/m.138617 type:complete len:83 (-) Transcript_49080:33-281(-)
MARLSARLELTRVALGSAQLRRRGRAPAPHFDRWRIFRRFFCRRRVLFFFHFQRNIERAFLYGLDLCAIGNAGGPDPMPGLF